MFGQRPPTAARARPATSAVAPSLWIRLLAVRRALVSIAIRGLWAALLCLHIHLLWQRITNLTLFEPLVAVRWGTAVLTITALVRLRHIGVPLFRGRAAMILWLVILLLHAGSAAAVGSQLEIVADAGLLVAASLWFLALADVFGKRPRKAGLVLRRAWVPRLVPAPLPCAAGSLAPLSPRPPPLT